VEILPVKPELSGVICRTGAVVNATNVEFPYARNERAPDGNAIADFPTKSLGRAFAHERSFAIGNKCLPLIIGDPEFRKHLAHSIGIDRELGGKSCARPDRRHQTSSQM